MEISPATLDEVTPRFRFLPRSGSWAFHLMLAAVALLILGPLGGLAAAYMNFTLGIFVPGQLLAGILGSVVTYGYGAQGRHGANYMQTMAASVASLGAMAVLIQAATLAGHGAARRSGSSSSSSPAPGCSASGWGCSTRRSSSTGCSSTYPSGLAVANILRALTDKMLLKRSIGSLATGRRAGSGGRLADRQGPLHRRQRTVDVQRRRGDDRRLADHHSRLRPGGRSASRSPPGSAPTAGWARTSRSAASASWWAWPGSWGRRWWTSPSSPGRRWPGPASGASRTAPAPAERKGLGLGTLVAWVAFWAVATLVVATQLLHQPASYILFGLALSLLFVFINGISMGVSDQNPISSAFVVSVLLMSALGLQNPVVALMAATILLICSSVGVDMQQDRSTGWRLGTDRRIQFYYQVLGIGMGAVLCVVLARVFMSAYPVLTINSFDHPEARVGQWQSAMTYKFVGAIRGLGTLPQHSWWRWRSASPSASSSRCSARSSAAIRATWPSSSGRSTGKAVGWLTDAVLLPSPYAYSLGTFVEFPTAVWWGAGGVLSSVWNTRHPAAGTGRPRRGRRAARGHDHHLAGGRWAHRRRVAVLPGAGAHRAQRPGLGSDQASLRATRSRAQPPASAAGAISRAAARSYQRRPGLRLEHRVRARADHDERGHPRRVRR